MSVFSFHADHLSQSHNYKTDLNNFQLSLPKKNQLTQLFLDKKTIIKRLQKLMLDIKDFQQKMFISKTISYLAHNLVEQTNFFKGYDIDKIDHKDNESRKVKSNLFSNNSLEIKQQQKPSNMKVLMTIPLIQDKNIKSKYQNQCFGETAASESFFNSNKGFNSIKPSVVEQTYSESGTLQCQCGILDWLLQMISQLIDKGIVKNPNQANNQLLQIDQKFLNDITQQMIKSFETLKEKQKSLSAKMRQFTHTFQKLKIQHKNQLKKCTDNLADKLGQNLQLMKKLKKFSSEIEKASKQIWSFNSKSEQLQRQLAELKLLKVSLQDKLSGCYKNLQKSYFAKNFLEESKNLEIDSFKFQIQLKDNQISNMKTIIQSLEKRSKQYDFKIEALKKTQSSSDQTIQLTLNYVIDVYLNNQLIQNQPQKNVDKRKGQGALEELKQFKQLKLQNNLLKQECILLYEKLTQVELLGSF